MPTVASHSTPTRSMETTPVPTVASQSITTRSMETTPVPTVASHSTATRSRRLTKAMTVHVPCFDARLTDMPKLLHNSRCSETESN